MNDLIHGIFKLEVHASLRAEELFHVGPVAITNSALMMWLVMVVLVLFAYFAGRRPKLVPSGAQNVFEVILEFMLTMVENTAGHYARRVFPLVMTLFIFILTANYMGLLPGVGTILIRNPAVAAEAAAPKSTPAQASTTAQPAKASKEKAEPQMVPLLRSVNADVNTTLGMALIAFIFIHYSGIAIHGVWGYIRDDLANPPLMFPVKLVIECFVPVSLSMRLFGNIFGGEMLLTVMAFPVLAVPFMFMELLFGFIQAIIFSLLTLIFTSLASHLPEGHEAGEHTELPAHPTAGSAATAAAAHA